MSHSPETKWGIPQSVVYIWRRPQTTPDSDSKQELKHTADCLWDLFHCILLLTEAEKAHSQLTQEDTRPTAQNSSIDGPYKHRTCLWGTLFKPMLIQISVVFADVSNAAVFSAVLTA